MRRDGASRGASSPERGSNRAERMTHITPGHVRAFHMLTSQLYDNITLWSCWIDNAPGVAIVLVDEVGEGQVAVMPLFVAITENMHLRFDDERDGDGGGGGPKRSETLRQFDANKAMVMPGGAS